MPPHPLTNFEILKYCQSEPKLNGVYSRNNLPKIKDGAYVINLEEFKSIGFKSIGYLCMLIIIMLTAWELDIFPKKLKKL